MSAYDGLNLPQLLELMHELHLPEPISMIPQTPGWWVLGGWLAAIALVVIDQVVKRRRHNRYRREAQTSLDGIAARAADDPSGSAQEIAALLKRTALAAYPRETVASAIRRRLGCVPDQDGRQRPRSRRGRRPARLRRLPCRRGRQRPRQARPPLDQAAPCLTWPPPGRSC